MHAMTRGLAGVALLSLGAVGCGDDAARIETLEADLASVTAERDQLATQVSNREERHAASQATIEGIEAILADPDAFGTESEVANALASFATADAVMDDAVFGAVGYRTAWYNTLFSGAIDADIDVYHRWLSEDGSQGGSLWVWYGTNQAGNPFELAGISLTEFDEEGRLTYEFVTYPYPDEYVEAAVAGRGTTLQLSAVTEPAARPFAFGDDDLCAWITEDEIAAMVSAVYDWEGDASEVEPYEFACRWELSGGGTVPPIVGIAEADHAGDPTRQWDAGEPDTFGDVVIVGRPGISDRAGYVVGVFGYFAVGVPDDGRFVQLFVMMPEDAQFDDWVEHAARLGDLVLHELGWLG